jgi:hypothetical protein
MSPSIPLQPRCFVSRAVPRPSSFLQEEIERLDLSGLLRLVEYLRWISRVFFVPTPAGSGWRLFVDLRDINKACQTRRIKMETMWSLRLIAKQGENWVSFDLKNEFYSLTIAHQDKEAFPDNIDGKQLQLCALPMGWRISLVVFQKLAEVFTDNLRDLESTTSSPRGQHDLGPKALKRWCRCRSMLARARLLPCVDDFALFEMPYDETLKPKVYIFTLLPRLGLKFHPIK